MNYPPSHRPHRSTGYALPYLLVFVFLLVVTPSLPKSEAARRINSTRTDSGQNIPAISFAALYRQTNLVSNLPGVALVEDRQLVNPWGVALNSTSPFWVVNNNNDLAALYKGDVSGGPRR